MKKIDIYQVDTAIPIPERKQKLPINLLEVGESFLFPGAERNRIQTRASQLKKAGKEFTIKKQDNATARIWRIK